MSRGLLELVVPPGPDADAERARRVAVLQRAESELDPLPFDAEAARSFGRVSAAVTTVGRSARSRTADLMIAAVAMSNDLPLYTTNPNDFAGLAGLLTVVPVALPPLVP